MSDSKPPSQIKNFLDKFQLPKLNNTEIKECDNELPEKKNVHVLNEYPK